MRKKYISIFMILILSLGITIGSYQKAEAAALPSLAYTAIPMIYEVMTSMFVAQGIGDSEYWNSKSSSEKKNLEDQFQTFYAGYDLSDEQKKYLSYYQKNEHSGQWLIAPISSGQLLVSRTIMDIAANFANENGMLGGGSPTITVAGGVLFPTVGERIVLTSSNNDAVAYANYVLGGAQPGDGHYSGAQKALAYVKAHLSSGFYVEIGFTNWSYNYTTRIKYKSAISIENANYTGNNINMNSPYVRYTLSDLTCTEIVYNDKTGEETVQQSNFNQYGLQQSIGNSIVSSLGIGIEGGYAPPIGEKGQTTIDNGVVTLPYEQGQHVNIDNYGDSVPLSLPDNIAKDLVIWQGAIENAADAVVQGVEAIQQKALPIDYTQTVAQEGTLAISEPLAIAPDIIGNVPAFTVPDFIKRKFPFCIPFDLVEAVGKFNSAGSTAPVIDYDFTLSGQQVKLYFDFAVFNDVARIVRVGVLILTLIGLIKATGDLIKW